MGQNPGFFEDRNPGGAKAVQTPRAEAKKAVKLSYKDQRRLEELEGLIAALPGQIARLDAELADPDLYARDRARFDRTMKAADKARADLAAAEDEWLALEEKRESLAG
jgi:ATP-binding cassette subfamily F protein uup